MWSVSSTRAMRALATASASSSSSLLLPPPSWHQALRAASTEAHQSSEGSNSAQDNFVPNIRVTGNSDRGDKAQKLRAPSGQSSTSLKGPKSRPNQDSKNGTRKQYSPSHGSFKDKKSSQVKSGCGDDASSAQSRPPKLNRQSSTRLQAIYGTSHLLITKHKTSWQHRSPDSETPAITASSDSVDLGKAKEVETPEEDALASAQDHLRNFFGRKTGSKSLATTDEPFAESSIHNVNPAAATDLESEHFGTLIRVNKEETKSTTAEASASQAQPSPQFSRPTLSDIENADMDQFAGVYRSETAWDPKKDYALMQDGPHRRSFLETALEQGPRQYVVVILDADNLLFDPRHLQKGYDGGKFVFSELRQRIARKHQLIPHLLDLRIRIFCALNSLATVLDTSRVVRRDFFFDFLQGICDSSLHNYVINVGRGSQAADLRVKAALADALRDPGCFRAYLGGLDDFGYKEELRTIQEKGLLESKVNLVQVPGYAVKSNTYKEYAHRAIDLDYLFKNNEAARLEMQAYNQEVFNAVDAVDTMTLALANTPCVFHHLSQEGCAQGDLCKYSHEPISAGHKEWLRRKLKKRKCPTVSRGEDCHFGEHCLFTH